jgi:hypothetical protein
VQDLDFRARKLEAFRPLEIEAFQHLLFHGERREIGAMKSAGRQLIVFMTPFGVVGSVRRLYDLLENAVHCAGPRSQRIFSGARR